MACLWKSFFFFRYLLCDKILGSKDKEMLDFQCNTQGLFLSLLGKILRSPHPVCIPIYQSGRVHIYICCECVVTPKPLDILDLLSPCLLNRGQAHTRYVKHVPDMSQMRNGFSAHTVSTAYLGCTDLTAPVCVDLTWTLQLPSAREFELSENYCADHLVI